VKLLVHVQRQPDMAYPGSATQQPGAAYQRAGDETAISGTISPRRIALAKRDS